MPPAKSLVCSGTAHDAQANHMLVNREEASVQRASQMFLQQVEDSRRKYAFEVEELKVPKQLSRYNAHPILTWPQPEMRHKAILPGDATLLCLPGSHFPAYSPPVDAGRSMQVG